MNPLAALARELQSRGDRVTFLQIPDLELKVQLEGVNFYPIGQTIYRPGSIAKNQGVQLVIAHGGGLNAQAVRSLQSLQRQCTCSQHQDRHGIILR